MADKPRVLVEYIEVENLDSVIGRVVWEHGFHMLLDAMAYVPNRADEVKPPGSRRLFRVAKVRREYLKTKTRIKVLVVAAHA